MSLPISGFTAVPNPQMLSYMMSQSWIMMFAAGGAWQYGKRRISAMSNEEFNKTTPLSLLKEHTQLLREAIPSIQQSLNDMTPLIKTLMEQFGDFVNEAVKAIPQTVANILGTPGGEFSNIPTTVGVAGGGAPPFGTAAFLHYFKTLSDATKKEVIENIPIPKKFPISDQLARLQVRSGIKFKGTTAGLRQPVLLHPLKKIFGNKSRQSLQIHYREQSALIKKKSLEFASASKTIRRFAHWKHTLGGRRKAVYAQVENPRLKIIEKEIQKAQQRVIDIIAYFKLMKWLF